MTKGKQQEEEEDEEEEEEKRRAKSVRPTNQPLLQSPADTRQLDLLARPLEPPNPDIKPTMLYCKNRDVDHINLSELRKIEAPAITFAAMV